MRRETRPPVLAALLVISVLVHVGAFALLRGAERPAVAAASKPMELVVIEIQKPEPPPEEPKKEEPPPEPVKVVKPAPKPKVIPPPIKVAKTDLPPPPPEDAPPPPNDTPPPEQPAKPAPLVVGISMSSTSSSGSFAAPVGNTLYGQSEKKAKDPAQVKQYSAPKYVPVYQADSEPAVLNQPKVDYPPEAKRAGVEGTVRLKILVDFEGKVISAKVISGLGFGLDEAALSAVKRFKWKPAVKNGESVSTEIVYAYTFLLD